MPILRAFLPAAAIAAMAWAWPLLPAGAQAQAPAAQCDGVQQDKAACQREAGAARQEAGRGGLTTAAPSSQEANALARCQNLPGADKVDCEAGVRGGAGGAGGGSSSGSVMGGGVIRETVTPVPAPAK